MRSTNNHYDHKEPWMSVALPAILLPPTVAAVSHTATAKTAPSGTLIPDLPNNNEVVIMQINLGYNVNGISKTDGASTFTFTPSRLSHPTPKHRIRLSFYKIDVLILLKQRLQYAIFTLKSTSTNCEYPQMIMSYCNGLKHIHENVLIIVYEIDV